MECLIDTGSDVSTITKDFFNEHIRAHVADPMAIKWLRVVATNGLNVPLTGYILTDVQVGNTVLKDRGFLIVPGHEGRRWPGLAGMNVLGQLPEFAQSLKNLADSGAQTAGKTSPSPVTRTIGVAKTSGATSVCIPAQSTTFLPVHSARCEELAVLEPLRNLPPGLAVMSTLTDQSRFKVPVCNLSEHDNWMNANFRISL